MANISNDERNMISLPLEGGGGEEEEEEDMHNEVNIPAKTEPEPIKIAEEPTSEIYNF